MEILRIVREIIFWVVVGAVSMIFVQTLWISICMFTKPGALQSLQGTHLWSKGPIVSIYIPTHYQGSHCAQGYEPLRLKNTIPSITSGPCGCVQNMVHQSLNQSCLPSRNAKVCSSLPALPTVESQLWRKSIICIRPNDHATIVTPVSEKDVWWYEKFLTRRTLPYSQNHCPSGYKRCGESTVCMPSTAECPITNMIILPADDTPPDESWEFSGTFSESNLSLYVRRGYKNELPVVDVVVKLTQFSEVGKNTRGVCYDGSDQAVHKPLVANASNLWSFDIELPPPCVVTDSRYTLVDTLTLQDHFLQNLQLTERACEGFALYPLSDPRYQPALDPDYLNSGVKCNFTSQYACMRDPYQRTDCAAGDGICDGVMNQNICGAYAHAVRSGFRHTNDISLGLYFARRVKWTKTCDMHERKMEKRALHYSASSAEHTLGLIIAIFAWFMFIFGNPCESKIRYMLDYRTCLPSILLTIFDLCVIAHMRSLFDDVCVESCTDAIIRENLCNKLASVVAIQRNVYGILALVSLIAVESAIQARWTLRHSKLVQRSYEDEFGRTFKHFVLEPIVPASESDIDGVLCTTTATAIRNKKRSGELGY